MFWLGTCCWNPPVVTAIEWTGRLSRCLCCRYYLKAVWLWLVVCSGYLIFFETLSVNFLEPIPISGGNFWFHRNMAGCGTPRQSRPMCQDIMIACGPHITLFTTVLTCWNRDSLLDFVQVWLKLETQGFLISELLQESSLQSHIGKLSRLVCNYRAHFHLNIVHLWNRINSRHCD